MDRGAWQATDHGVTKSPTQRNRLSTHPRTIDISAQFLASQKKHHIPQPSLKLGVTTIVFFGQGDFCGGSVLRLPPGKQLALRCAFFPRPHPPAHSVDAGSAVPSWSPPTRAGSQDAGQKAGGGLNRPAPLECRAHHSALQPPSELSPRRSPTSVSCRSRLYLGSLLLQTQNYLC